MNDGLKDSILLGDVVTDRRIDIGSIENNIFPIPGQCYTLHTETSIDMAIPSSSAAVLSEM